MNGLPFLTAYNPLGGTAGSIDPLGALRTYGTLVDFILPGITTITNRSRYLTMICTAIANAEQHRNFPIGPAGSTERRIAAQPYERLWALACVATKQRGIPSAAEKLRGVTYAEGALQDFQSRNSLASLDFKMLQNQYRTGGVATYWTTLAKSDLIKENGSLTHEGEELAKEFPPPPEEVDLKRLADPIASRRISVSLESLNKWGRSCHLGAATPKEKRLLVEALRCNDRRDRIAWSIEKYLSKNQLPEVWKVPHLQALLLILSSDETALRLTLPTTIQAIIRFEGFHEAVLNIFERVLWWGTIFSERPIAELISRNSFQEATDLARGQGNEFVCFYNDRCGATTVHRAIREFKEFSHEIARLRNPQEIVDEILRRHQRVQSGKIDGGMPKREWVTYGPGGHVIRPPLRHQLQECPPRPNGETLTHPYRMEEFVSMLNENGALPR